MGTTASKPQESTTTTANPAVSENINTQNTSNDTTGETSKCPMKFEKKSNGGTCPMKFKKKANDDTTTNTSSSSSVSACPVKQTNSGNSNASTTTTTSGSACPVKHNSAQTTQYNVYSQPLDPKNNMPSVANQLPSSQQKEELSTERVKSTIPKGGTGNDTWVYPSPQMFYNALARKNKLDDTTEDDIPSVVALHNNMNEKTWAKILEWEAVLDPQQPLNSQTPKLSRFLGRPSDLSPKARFKNVLLTHPLPFDRHDWTIVRPDGTEVRYVIDYYHDETRASEQPNSGMPNMGDREAVQSILVDVRPALDSISEFKGRFFTMPLARKLGETSFAPLPVFPTQEMKGQVKESIQVWDNIQKQAKLNAKPVAKDMTLKAEDLKDKDYEDEEKEAAGKFQTQMDQMTSEKATQLAKSFADVLKQCSQAKQKMESCDKEEEYAQASLTLSMCMAQIVCPLQHSTVVKTLHSEEEHQDAKVDTALENMLSCVGMENERVAMARMKFPLLFSEDNGSQ